MGAKARKKKREKKRVREEEAKLEKEKEEVVDAALWKEDVEGKPPRKRRRKDKLAYNQEIVKKLTGPQQVAKFIADWNLPPNQKQERYKRPHKQEALSDLWAGTGPVKKECVPDNRTVDLKIKTFSPKTFQSFNPSEKQREAGLDAIGAHWEKYDGKRIKAAEKDRQDAADYLERFKALEEEEFLYSSHSESDSGVEEPGVRYRPDSLKKKLKVQRNKYKRNRAELLKIRERKTAKAFEKQFDSIKKFQKEITTHKREVAGRPKKERIIRRISANSKAYEPSMPMLLTSEEVESSQGTLRRVAIHKDSMHDVVKGYQLKRVLNPKPPRKRRRRRTKYVTHIRFGSGKSVNINTLINDFLKA